ncbi:rCG21925 [Rattus norvegicus]|uniref:RCG21925 n=1 Tax=Rattus norvegicus TaxID=10116 RepID=A6J1D9_RAT|nr:rCG21925 [Rattus norvegicus]
MCTAGSEAGPEVELRDGGSPLEVKSSSSQHP